MALKLLKYHWRAVVWLVIIVFGCLTPEKNVSESHFFSLLFSKIPHFDKIVHFILYFVFTLFLMSGFLRQYGVKSLKAYCYAFFIPFSIGIAIEFIQGEIGRSCSIYDVFADTLGIAIALLLFNPVKWILRNIL